MQMFLIVITIRGKFAPVLQSSWVLVLWCGSSRHTATNHIEKYSFESLYISIIKSTWVSSKTVKLFFVIFPGNTKGLSIQFNQTSNHLKLL